VLIYPAAKRRGGRVWFNAPVLKTDGGEVLELVEVVGEGVEVFFESTGEDGVGVGGVNEVVLDDVVGLAEVFSGEVGFDLF